MRSAHFLFAFPGASCRGLLKWEVGSDSTHGAERAAKGKHNIPGPHLSHAVVFHGDLAVEEVDEVSVIDRLNEVGLWEEGDSRGVRMDHTHTHCICTHTLQN